MRQIVALLRRHQHTTQDALHHASQKSTKRYNRHLSSDRKDGTSALAEKLPSVDPVLQH